MTVIRTDQSPFAIYPDPGAFELSNAGKDFSGCLADLEKKVQGAMAMDPKFLVSNTSIFTASGLKVMQTSVDEVLKKMRETVTQFWATAMTNRKDRWNPATAPFCVLFGEKFIASDLCEVKTPKRVHKRRRRHSLRYHFRIQKKWNKRFGFTVEHHSYRVAPDLWVVSKATLKALQQPQSIKKDQV